ncbi:hypothetical protein ACFYVR_16850 [Rhodococcus sp. NPDC003318]|uniref:hypothetical protein n=1 Tax=Rhodococcus sp. NPDC003318 TaxID=3364503 RepID=UPI0036BC159C
MYQTFTNAITDRQIAALTRESSDRQAAAERIESQRYRLVGNHVVSTAAFRFSETGPTMAAFLRSGVLTGLLRTHVGVDLEPVDTSYNYYDVGDHIGIHRDAPSCRYAALITLSPTIQPLILYPELAPLDGRAMHERIRAGRLGHEEHVTLPYLGVVVLHGSVVPHQRPTSTRACSVTTVCFGRAA